MGKVLSAADILGAADRRVEPVEVPEWGGTVYVRTMDGLERDNFDAASLGADDRTNLANYRARLVAATACDADGKLLFTASQALELGRKSSPAIIRVFVAAQQINLMGPFAAEAKKNSAGTDSAASPTDSPSPSASGT